MELISTVKCPKTLSPQQLDPNTIKVDGKKRKSRLPIGLLRNRSRRVLILEYIRSEKNSKAKQQVAIRRAVLSGGRATPRFDGAIQKPSAVSLAATVSFCELPSSFTLTFTTPCTCAVLRTVLCE